VEEINISGDCAAGSPQARLSRVRVGGGAVGVVEEIVIRNAAAEP